MTATDVKSPPASHQSLEEVAPYLSEYGVMDLFRRQVETRSAKIAVQDGERLRTYRDLDLLSDRVAHALTERGLGSEDIVIVFLPASYEFLAAVVGVLKAGGTFLTLDPGTPRQRLDFLLSDSRSRFIISSDSYRAPLDSWSHLILDLDQMCANPHGELDAPWIAEYQPDHRTYITYTSGSTGQPKGVEIEYRSLSNLVRCYHEQLNLTAGDRVSMLAYVAFDASVAEVWPSLCAGATIVIPPKELALNPDRLIAWLAEEEITFAFVPTGLAEILFTRPWPHAIRLKYFITGGDRLRSYPPAGLPFSVLNAYGPTENTVISTWSLLTLGNNVNQPPPIGRPLSNTTAYVLDEDLRPVPLNESGELYVGGEQVARGYLNRSSLTRERFLPDLFANKPGARMYRTGDWVRRLPNGELDFIGRKDGQIQIRGRRVELGEIEAALFTHSSICRVCCVPVMDDGMPSGVIAHIVAHQPSAQLADALRAFLASQLPEYMIPAKFVFHENFPLTPQGKLDRAALAASASKSGVASSVGDNAGGLEQALGRLWHTLLPAAADAPRDAAFSALGGDSLLAMKLVLSVEDIIGAPLEVSSFLVQPTFQGLCEAVRARLAETKTFQPFLKLRPHGSRPPLFLLYGVDGDVGTCFHLVDALGDDQPVIALRSPALHDHGLLPTSMEQAATEALGWIRKLQPTGPLALAGYSWAGLLTFEMARQVANAGGQPGFAALIGTPAPMRPTNLVSRLTHGLRHFPVWCWRLMRDGAQRRNRLLRWREMVRTAQAHIAKPHVPPAGWTSSVVSQRMIKLMEDYRPSPRTDIELDLFYEKHRSNPHPLRAWQTNHLPDGGWSHWLGSKHRVHKVDGDHWNMVKPPSVASLAQSIRQAMDRHFAQPVNLANR